MNTFYYLILGVLGVWRITHLLNAEDGPGKIFVQLRELAGSGFWGELLDCFYCLSLWVALPFALLTGSSWRERLLLWLALSGAAMLLEGMHKQSPPHYFEESPAAQDAKEGHQ
jgi:hypothetical protein